ncbi:MAG: hypothetical protein HQK97_09125, partial [Nitrospirae bacterium]|nr:hypothetical protein [Nitrospirota bacterium]
MKRSVYLFIVVVVMAASAALSALNLSASSVDAAVDAAAGAAENSASSYIAASTAIKAYYNQYPSYFGTASGSVNTITDGSGTWYYQWYVSGAAIRAIVAYSDGSLYWLDGANWHNTGQSWLPSTDINNATTAIKAFYKQYMAYFGTASGVVTKYTDGSGTWYYQWYTKGAAIIAYSDGNLYWIDGRSWHATGQSWQPATDLSNATSAISSFYNQYPSYFGISSGVVTSYIDSTGTWYYQWFSKGTAIIAYSDGNLYWFDGRSWNATGQSWQPSTDLSNATSAIQSFYNQYPAVFGGASGSVGSNIDGNGIYYFQ